MCKAWFALSLGLLATTAQATPPSSVASLLHQADSYRLPAAASRVETDITVFRNDTIDKERRYTVYIKPGRRSLVLMKSPSEIGQKVLMLADQFWLLMPESQRPLRITPSQKLLGEASTGDIASMTWSEDYTGQVAEELPCPTAPTTLQEWQDMPRNRTCLHLSLTATQPGVTYSQVELYLDKTQKIPVKADLFVSSGKRAKEAWYATLPYAGQLRVTAMLLIDEIQLSRRTLVRYRSLTAKEAPDEFFNPAALIRQSVAGW